jgi:predicted neuraminidase
MKTRFLSIFLLLTITGLAAEPRHSAVIASAFINEHAPYPECHASTLVEVAPGKLVAAWFGGTREGAPDVGIWVARREEGRWLDAVEVANGLQPDGTRLPTWNPVLFQPKDGPLVLFYKVGPSPSAWWGMMMTSADGGKSWNKPVRLPTGVLGPIKNKPVLLADGTWLCPSSTEGGEAGWQVHFELAHDAGPTWEIIGPVEKGNKLDAIQPTVLFHRDGRLQALCRTRNGVIATTWSRDGGKRWSPLEAVGLPNPNSGIDAVTLADGRQLLVYNHSAPPPDRPTKGVRYPLDVAISSDGVKWQHVLTLEDQPSDNGYAYPAVIQTSDGLVHITYTWNRQHIKYVVLDPKQLVSGGDRAVFAIESGNYVFESQLVPQAH